MVFPKCVAYHTVHESDKDSVLIRNSLLEHWRYTHGAEIAEFLLLKGKDTSWAMNPDNYAQLYTWLQESGAVAVIEVPATTPECQPHESINHVPPGRDINEDEELDLSYLGKNLGGD